MNEITIVTAFFDIGRGDWSMDKGYPHYLQRTNETYLERFSHLAKLQNEMVIYTESKFVDQIKKIRYGLPTSVVTIDINEAFSDSIREIAICQEKISKFVNSTQIKNPEYWNPQYVLINYLKSWFVNDAIKKCFANNSTVAWIDFGYCRDEKTIANLSKWTYNFASDKIHLFDYKDFDNNMKIFDVIQNNIVHILGAKIVANKEMWPIMQDLMTRSYNMLISNGLIDDDQTMMLMSYMMAPQVFEKHRISESDPFVIFRNFSNKE